MTGRRDDFGSWRRHWLAWPFELVFLIAFFVTLSQGETKFAAESGFLFVVSFLPQLLERFLRVRIPLSYQAIYSGFLFISMFSGEVLKMYGRWYPWDDMTHFISGMLIGWGVFVIARSNRIRHKLPLTWLSLAAVMIGASCTISMLWELIEFGSDQLFGTYSQGKDLIDTMLDMLDGLVGTAVVAVLAALYLKGKPSFGLGWLVARFDAINPSLAPKSAGNSV